MILNPAVDPSFVNLAHDPQQFFGLFHFHILGEFATGRIARFLRHRIAFQLLGMEWPFRVSRLALHLKNRTLCPVQLPDLG